jgi:hypothetical protein
VLTRAVLQEARRLLVWGGTVIEGPVLCVLDPAYVSAPTAIVIVGCRQRSVGKWVVN